MPRAIAASVVSCVTRVACAACVALASAACASRAPLPRACDDGLVAIDGACLSPRERDAYCGGSCVVPSCDEGDAIDPRRGECVPALTARALASRDRNVPDDMRLACRRGAALVASGDRVACLPRASLCPRVAPWSDARAACVAEEPCGAGAIRGARGCASLVGDRGVVDVGLWSRLALGDDGGAGSARLCGELAKAPWTLDVGPGESRPITLAVALVFPDNDVSQASSRVSAAAEPGHLGPALSAAGVAAADRAVASLLGPLRDLGGVADAAGVTTRVTCRVAGGWAPMLLPRAN